MEQEKKPDNPDIPAQNTNPEQNNPNSPTDNTELETLKQSRTEYEKALKSIFGVADEEELGDLSQRMTAYNDSLKQKQALIDSKIITAELKSLQGYDTKLLAKVLDYGDIKVSEDGTVTGLKEAVKSAEKEYPAVILKQTNEPYAPYHPVGTSDTHKSMNDIIRNRRSY